jgi:hypothetical protein
MKVTTDILEDEDFIKALTVQIHGQQHGFMAGKGLTQTGRDMYYRRTREALQAALEPDARRWVDTDK